MALLFEKSARGSISSSASTPSSMRHRVLCISHTINVLPSLKVCPATLSTAGAEWRPWRCIRRIPALGLQKRGREEREVEAEGGRGGGR